MALESVRYDKESGAMQVLDQLKLPVETEYVVVRHAEDAWAAIRSMQVRGAPLIAIVAALGLAVEVHHREEFWTEEERASAGSVRDKLCERLERLRTSRPTAVNLFTAADELQSIVSRAAELGEATADTVAQAYLDAAESMHAADLAGNRAMGSFGAEAALQCAGRTAAEGIAVLTHCNTGSLATAGFGTALGVVRELHDRGALRHVFATETRPYNQGARLTAYEIAQDGLPGTLVTDSMASALIAQGRVDCILVGADRVAANGDTANKIGTYQLAVTAKHHKIPFFVVAPLTTLDAYVSCGADIVIEERPAVEMTRVHGVQIAPEDGVGVWNPAFDVTPASLISGIVTDKGTVPPRMTKDGHEFDVATFLNLNGRDTTGTSAAAPAGYTPLNMDSTAAAKYIVGVPALAKLLGTTNFEEVRMTEVGDGNLNLVFIVEGPQSTIVVKQALPYVRCVGESWPLTLDRAYFEHGALAAERAICPELVPELYHFDRALGVIAMRFVEPPHLILRKHLIAGTRLSTVASDLATFAARTLFFTSGVHLSAPQLRQRVTKWSQNWQLCALTEQVIFTEPYIEASNNHWTSPQLDNVASSLREDTLLKIAVCKLKHKFIHDTQALIHGDLHTGSVMAMEGSTFCIDSEFAFYGPMGFDVGAVLANLLLAYFSQKGHGNGDDYAEWVLQQAHDFLKLFSERFMDLWTPANTVHGDEFKSVMFGTDSEALAMAQQVYMEQLFQDTLGFAGCKMIRRIVGIAHVEDLESISDPDVRADAETRAIEVAREMILSTEKYATPAAVCDLARSAYLRE